VILAVVAFKIGQILGDSSNHEWTRMYAKKWSDSRPLASIRGSFSCLLIGVRGPAVIVAMLTFKIGQILGNSSNHERTRIDTKKWSDLRPLVSIRGSFSSLFVGATPRCVHRTN
jgi:hypothetical protein